MPMLEKLLGLAYDVLVRYENGQVCRVTTNCCYTITCDALTRGSLIWWLEGCQILPRKELIHFNARSVNEIADALESLKHDTLTPATIPGLDIDQVGYHSKCPCFFESAVSELMQTARCPVLDSHRQHM